MNLFAIFGSGFGLYGYLPALISCQQAVVLPDRYRNRLNARPELHSYAKQVEWTADEYAALQRATGIVIALSPSQQLEWVPRCLLQSNLEYLLLEKPLAQSPQSSAALFDKLLSSGKNFRIGYTFRYTPWGKQLLTQLRCTHNVSKLSIRWFFQAHHFRHNMQTWKRSHTAGGGVIRFYGVHIIALLAEIGYSDVILSKAIGFPADECEKWQAIFTGAGLPPCEITIDSRASINQFQVVPQLASVKNVTTINLDDPFNLGNQANTCKMLDQRVPILQQLCSSLWQPNTNRYERYAAAIQLWLTVENKTVFEEQPT